MRVIVGLVVIVVGIAQFAFRQRLARANSASTSVLFNGRFSGPRMTRYNAASSGLAGVGFVVFGVLLIAGVIGHH